LNEKKLHKRELNSYKDVHSNHAEYLNRQIEDLQKSNDKIRGDWESSVTKSQKLQFDLSDQKSELSKQRLRVLELENEKSSLNLRIQDVLTREAHHSEKVSKMENQIQELQNCNTNTGQRLKATIANLEEERASADRLRQLLLANKAESSRQLELKRLSGAILVDTLLATMTALRNAHVRLNFELERNKRLISAVGERNIRIDSLAQSNATYGREKRTLEAESTNLSSKIQELRTQISNDAENLKSFKAHYEECAQGLKHHFVSLKIAVQQIVDLKGKLKSANKSFDTMKISYNQQLVASNQFQDDVYALRDENHNSCLEVTSMKAKFERLQATSDTIKQKNAEIHRSLISAQTIVDTVPHLKQELAKMGQAHQSLKHTMSADCRLHKAIADQLTMSLQTFSQNYTSLKDNELSTHLSIINALGIPPDQSGSDVDTLCKTTKDLVVTKNSVESEANDLRNFLSNKEVELSNMRKLVDETKDLADSNKSLADKYHYTSIEFRKNIDIVINKIKADHAEHVSALKADYQRIIITDRNTPPGEIPQYPPSKLRELAQKRLEAAASSETHT
jgi:chromosome segregation ATPase